MNIKKIIALFLVVFSLYTLSACNKNIESSSEKNVKESTSQDVNIKNISLDDFKTELSKNTATIIDLRTTPELEDTGIISGAIQIDFYADNFEESINALDTSSHYLIYCRSGNRSGKTLSLMKDLGFTNVGELSGGMNNWLRSGEVTEKYTK